MWLETHFGLSMVIRMLLIINLLKFSCAFSIFDLFISIHSKLNLIISHAGTDYRIFSAPGSDPLWSNAWFFSLETGLKFSLRLLLKKLNKWKYVVCKCREKDNLWQQTDRLTYEQKMQSTAKWMDEKSVTHCLGCKTEFTFMVRKVHVVIFWFTIFFLP